MSDPILLPRTPRASMIVVWVIACAIAVVVGIVFETPERFGWLAVGAAVTLIISFAVNLWSGKHEGYIQRAAAAAVGGVVLMGVISLVIVVFDLMTV
ncbi:MAG: hypothetical protein QM607_11350 [Microbacterium sp.]